MEIGDWLQLVQTVCLLGAFVGLIVQLRFTAKIAKAAAYQSLVSQLESLHDRLYTSDDAQVLKDAMAPDVDVSPRQMVLALSLLNLLESAHFQYGLGVIPKKLWAGWQDQISTFFKMPFFRKIWRANRAAYNKSFRVLLDEADARAIGAPEKPGMEE
ncbi:MAG TPA: hypothetical protein VGQ21_02245 [Thermoanaerobaculia bacterium]|jgi:hypothetical protein|nr:hypothetical protein [Thermoanaerobaculia bacterium]